MPLISELARWRVSPRAGAIAISVLILGAAAVALALSDEQASAPARPKATRTARTRLPPTVPARQLARARQAARTFLAGYLRFAYGRAKAATVLAVTPGLRRELAREHARVTAVEQSRRPRVVWVTAYAHASGIVAIALVDDGGIVNYAVMLALQQHGASWLVSGVDGG